ncbi:hypothetical protein [Spirosoma rhododendri]|uniref:Uncharacterized protein n=1 Tax=Spirosoma rhododendri TaxID=2728024 RepID=A0A7L5DNX9_9BACT|nr:hypothetical protein [Spirosoma rhododendri]QJD79785.1 hypothetical protein HH216_16185 [Spirosoma rhododendri]
MQLQVDINFDQLIQLAKGLTPTQWATLKTAVDTADTAVNQPSDLEAFLLTAPTFTDEQIQEIAETRKRINQWRTS